MNNNQYNYCNIEGNTDVGCKRKANEDWLDSFQSDNGLVAVVCDGMGGHVGGKIASHVAVDAIRNFLTSNYFEDPRIAIVQACNAANQAILQRTVQQPELTGMGSTCVMLIVRDGKVYIGSVGDSRIYLVRSRTIKQLTKDQSYVQMLVDAGQITAEQAEHHPRKNEITNALGIQNMKPATVLEDPINPEAGDCFLLCSDGLSGMVSDAEIAKITGNQGRMSQRDRVNALIQKARDHGGLDNITCQIVEFSITPDTVIPSESSPEKKKTAMRYGIMAGAAVCILGASLFFLKGNNNTEENTLTATDSIKIPATIPCFVDTLLFNKTSKSFKIQIDTISRRISNLIDGNTKNTFEFPLYTSLDTSSVLNLREKSHCKLTNCENGYEISFSKEYKEDLIIRFKAQDTDSIYERKFVLEHIITKESEIEPSKDTAHKKKPKKGEVIIDNSSKGETPTVVPSSPAMPKKPATPGGKRHDSIKTNGNYVSV